MPKNKDQNVKLVASASSPVKLKAEANVAAAAKLLTPQNIMMVVGLVQQLIAFLEGPVGQGIITYIRDSKNSTFKEKVRLLGQRLTDAARD